MATIVAAAGGGDWNTGASWVGGVAPTAADNAQIPSTAGNMVIGSGAVCRGADFSTYTGQLSGTGTLTIGDATAGLTNIALKLVSGMTISGTPNFSFISTSATVQTVDFAGKTTGNVTFNAASNGSWQYTGGHTIGTAGVLTLTQGTLDINGQTCSWGQFSSSNALTRAITLGAAAITITGSSIVGWDIGTTTGMTTSCTSSTITLNGASVEFSGGSSKAYGTVNMTGSGTAKINSSATTFVNLNRTGTAVKSDGFNINGAKTVTGILTLAGNSVTNRLIVFANVVGTAAVITNVGATMTWSNVDFMDIQLGTAFDASAITGLSGDAGGNTNITFTTPATQTATASISKNWSDVTIWTSRVPLPQDNALLSGITGGTLTADMPRLGKSIDWTGATGAPTWGLNSVANTIFGSITLISGLTLVQDRNLTLGGRSSFTLTSAGQSWPQTGGSALFLSAPTGTYTLNDAFSTAGAFNFLQGTWNANNFNVTIRNMSGSNSNTRGLTMGSGTWTLTLGSGTPWTLATTTGLTFSGASSTIVLSGTNASVRTFSGGGLTYGILNYTVSGSTGGMDIIGSNTFSAILFSDDTNARTLRFTAGTTTTFTGSGLVGNGASGRRLVLSGITAATFTFAKASGNVSVDWWDITNSIGSDGSFWYAGANSLDTGGNTRWIFTVPPSSGAIGGGAGKILSRKNLQNLQRL